MSSGTETRHVQRQPGAWMGALTCLILATSCGAGKQPKPEIPEVRLVSFSTSDAGLVYADLYGKGTQGVVLVHGGRFDKESWKAQAESMAHSGLLVLALDLRGYGASRAGSQGAESPELDVLAAVRYLRQTGATSVSLVGASFGGGAAAEAAVLARAGEIDRLVLLAHVPIKNPEGMQGRKLFVVTREDKSGSGVLRLPSIRDQMERAPEPKELFLMEGSAHAQFIFETPEGELLMDKLVRFLSSE